MPQSIAKSVRPLFGRLRLAVAGAAACLLAVAVAWADPSIGDRADYGVALAVKAYLNRRHLSMMPLDDEISKRTYQNFLDRLDPLKLYFLKSDIEELQASETKLDDLINNGDLSFAYRCFDRFLDRVDSRLKLAEELLAGEFDFTRDEEIIRDPEDMDYVSTEEEAVDRWRRRLKFNLLVRMGDDTTLEEAKEAVQRRYQSFAKRMHQVDNEDLREIFLSSLTHAYDPHTEYMSGATVRSFEIQMSLELEGIGAELRYEDGSTTVHKVVPGGAAARDGRLAVGDRIIGVAQGQSTDFTNVEDMKLSDVVELIRGKKGTVVQLEVVAAEDEARRVYDITRDVIELKDKEAQGEVLTLGEGQDQFKVGVIQLPSFYMDMQRAQAGYSDYKSSTRDMRQLIDGFREQGVDAVMVDLRINGGGSLVEAIDATGLFIDRGPVVQVRDFNQNVEVYSDDDAGVAWDGPLVVLTSKLSASASEIFAGAIQDYGRGLVVGDSSTHGKGTVQSVFNLRQGIFQGLRNAITRVPDMGAVKLTTQQFYLPSGRSTQVRGVEPDVLLPSIFDEIASGEADLDYAFE